MSYVRYEQFIEEKARRSRVYLLGRSFGAAMATAALPVLVVLSGLEEAGKAFAARPPLKKRYEQGNPCP